MFESFSERARRIVFLSRKTAGRRGASVIGVEDLIDALVIEDQGDFLTAVSENTAPSAAVPVMPKYQPFLTAETAANIRRGLEPLMLPKREPLPDSADMPISDALKELLATAIKLGEELRGEPARPSRIQVGHPSRPSRIQVGHVEPLHLLAAALQGEESDVARILKQAGVTEDVVMDAVRNGEYS